MYDLLKYTNQRKSEEEIKTWSINRDLERITFFIGYNRVDAEVTLTTKTLEKAIRKYEENPYYYLEETILDIAKMNATVAPYRFGYDITPEYVKLLNNGANIKSPIVPSTNVLGGMVGNQGLTNQIDFNRINRGN